MGFEAEDARDFFFPHQFSMYFLHVQIWRCLDFFFGKSTKITSCHSMGFPSFELKERI